MLALRGTGKARTAAQARTLLAELGERYGLAVAADVPVEELPISQQQRIEILKALAADVRVLALDEPNALLTPGEWEQLAGILRVLADEGVAVVLISHKLDDVLALADRVTVLRRGRIVATTAVAEIDATRLGALMIGDLVSLTTPAHGDRADPVDRDLPAVEIHGLVVQDRDRPASVSDVSLQVGRGEIVGLAGVEGSGQVELTEALAGMRAPRRGRIVLGGSDITGLGVGARRRAGVSCVPADRHAVGMFDDLSVAENILLPALTEPPLSRFGLLSKKRMRQRADALVARFDIRVPHSGVRAGTLSGGNQQKMVLARELSSDPSLLICCYATRGLDFAAASAVRERVRAACAQGAGVLYASVDLDELIEISDRILVMHGGRIAGEVSHADADVETLGALMGGREAP
jgi:simple sugar transport system ATP-binding protein